MSEIDFLTGTYFVDYSTNQELITFSGDYVTFLQAAIPIFTQFVGSQLWKFIRLALWHFYFNAATHSACPPWSTRTFLQSQHEQLLCIIANSGGGLDLCSQLIKQAWVWRKWRQTHQLAGYRTVPPLVLMIFGFLYWSGWIALGVMTGRIWYPYSQVSNQTLARGSCGTVELFDVQNQTQYALSRAAANNRTLDASNYAQNCYPPGKAGPSNCATFASTNIPFTDYEVACPFTSSSVCISTNSTPRAFDTGLFSVSTWLGANAAASNDVFFRKYSTFSPVSSRGRAQIVDLNAMTAALDNQIWPNNSRVYRFYYGPFGAPDRPGASFNSEWTYEYSEWERFFQKKYGLDSFSYFPGKGNLWTPNATFFDPARDDADVTLTFIHGEHVAYQYENWDPVFSTGQSWTEKLGYINVTQYTPQYYTNVLAALDQYQLCKSATGPCTELSSSQSLTESIFSLGLNKQQLAIAERLANASSHLAIWEVVSGRAGSSLLVSQTLADTFQYQRLSNTQWTREASNWFATALATLQQLMLEFAIGPADEELLANLVPPSDPEVSAQCYNQRIFLPPGAVNVSFVGFVVIIGVGFGLWCLGTLAEPVHDFICSHFEFLEARRLRFVSQTPLGAQRLALRAAGYGTWGREHTDFPVWHYDSAGPAVLETNNRMPLLRPAPQNLTAVQFNAAIPNGALPNGVVANGAPPNPAPLQPPQLPHPVHMPPPIGPIPPARPPPPRPTPSVPVPAVSAPPTPAASQQNNAGGGISRPSASRPGPASAQRPP